MSPAGFELAIPGSERPQTDALDCAATDICDESDRNLVIIQMHQITVRHFGAKRNEKYL